MPLWKMYHTAGTLNDEHKAELAERITKMAYPILPVFYVGVVFEEIKESDFYIGGKPAERFVRIWVDHIARTLPTPEHRLRWLGMAREALEPMFSKLGIRWEMHVDETTRELWLIQGLVPPMQNTEAEAKWKTDNEPSPY
ncbi:tautomerase family protein [Burkholderia guangdongensis]|uniref:tautomerase family protein n=1 Tax=Burkholderia guangdongensis TaxID=1792500 RepID=UPI0015C77C61|nr:tautomerase family protein [Burkholderia guangdongensis]